MFKVYLAGAISENKETWEWRKKANELLIEDSIEVIIPTQNVLDYNKYLLKNKGMYRFTYPEATSQLLMKKCIQQVQECNICIVNFDIEMGDKPYVGTLFELGWLALYPEKMVIAISGNYTKSGIKNHPFIKSVVDLWTVDVYQACNAIKAIMSRDVGEF